MQTATDITVRELPAAEWERLRAFEPFASGGLPDAPEHWRVIVAEEAGTIVGFTCMYQTVHYEPIYIDPAHRHQPGLFAGLWRESKRIFDAHGIQLIHVTVPNSLPSQQRMVERFGFIPADGKLYLGEVDKIGV